MRRSGRGSGRKKGWEDREMRRRGRGSGRKEGGGEEGGGRGWVGGREEGSTYHILCTLVEVDRHSSLLFQQSLFNLTDTNKQKQERNHMTMYRVYIRCTCTKEYLKCKQDYKFKSAITVLGSSPT